MGDLLTNVKEIILKVLEFLKSKKGKTVGIAFLVLLLFSGGLIINASNKETNLENVVNNENNLEDLGIGVIAVEILGEVRNPGIYYMNDNDRVSDVIRVSGGLTNKGTTEGVNIAIKVSDGLKVYIPKKNDNSINLISLNTCSDVVLEELLTDIIGSTKAKAVVKYRKNNGYFSSVEDILKVSGITESVYSKVKEYLIL